MNIKFLKKNKVLDIIIYAVSIILFFCLIFLSGCFNDPGNIRRGINYVENVTEDSEIEIDNDTIETTKSTAEEIIPQEDDEGSIIDKERVLFSFTVTGDSRPADDYLPQPETFLKLLDLMNEEDSSFNISVGDIINGGTSDEEITKRQFTDYLNVVEGIYGINFVSPGNHDIFNDTTRKYFREMILKKTIQDVATSDIRFYNPGTEDNLDSFYYYFELNNIYFIILNAFERGSWGEVRSDQIAWLEDLLERLENEVVFITMHTPPYSVLNPDTITNGSKHVAFSSRENLEHIWELFKNYKVDGVFSGHEHVYNKELHDGTTYVVSALSGEYPFFPEEEGGFYHYLRVSIKSDSWMFNVIGIDGDIRYQEEIEYNR